MSTSIAQLGVTDAVGRVFGASTGKLLLEDDGLVASSSLLPADAPVLESGDYHYGDIRTTKENDLMVINASGFSGNLPVVAISGTYDAGGFIAVTLQAGVTYVWQPGPNETGTVIAIQGGPVVLTHAAGQFTAPITSCAIVGIPGRVYTGVLQQVIQPAGNITVQVDGRNFLGDTPTFLTNATWTTANQEALTTYGAVAGRIFRYRFTLNNARAAKFHAFSEAIYVKAAEK